MLFMYIILKNLNISWKFNLLLLLLRIDKFLEEYNSDGAEHTDDTSNFPDELVDDLLKNVDIADLVNTHFNITLLLLIIAQTNH